MRRATPWFLLLVLLSIAAPALADTTAPSSGFDLSWAALDPGNDWVANTVNAVFPVNGTPTNPTGSAASVIGLIVGQLTGFVSAIAMAYVCYLTIINIHRVAESSNLLSRGMTTMFVVRIGFAAAMMFPLASGFSAGQAFVVKTSMWGIGMAKAVYTNAVKAIGPDSMVIAQPQIPGTGTIVVNLMQDELCRALINQAAGNPNLVPVPKPVSVMDQTGGYITWSYSLSTGNETGSPVCGTVTIRQPQQGSISIAGVGVDMTGVQRSILTQVLEGDIRPAVQTVAQNFWQTKQVSALTSLNSTYVNATSDYTQQLTEQATTKTAELRAALADSAAARIGALGLIDNEDKLSALGWSAAGSYYEEFARLNGQTLSLLDATPTVNQPSFEGLSKSLSKDLAPLLRSQAAFLTKLQTMVNTTDGLDTPGGNSDLFSGATPGGDGAGVIEQIFRHLHLTETVLRAFTENMSPTGTQWTDPFGGLVQLGHKMILVSIVAMGSAGLLSSTTGTTASVIWNVLTGDFAGAGASLVGHMLMQFFATPIMLGCASIMLPGLTIAFVLPMIPYVMWTAGVFGYFILVCEAVVAVPLGMLAHMTFEGEGLHGRGREMYGLLFNLLFRPTLMLIGFFLSYLVFTSECWLIREGFGIAVGFVLQAGWLVTNFFGVMVLLSIYVLLHVTAAITAFRLISVIPHHLPRLIGFNSANRVDIDEFSRDAALIGVGRTMQTIQAGVQPRPQSGSQPQQSLPNPGTRALPSPSGRGTTRAAMDSTTRASTDTSTGKSEGS